MQSDASTASTVFSVIVGVMFTYGAYWALEIRTALMTPIYKRQAFWVALVGLYFVAFSAFVAAILFSGLQGFYVNVLAGSLIYAGFIVIFAWIDSTVRVARRSDPLLRDTLRWSKLRYFLAYFGLIGLTFNVAFNVILNSNVVGSSASLLGYPPFLGYVGTILFFGTIALLLSAKRSGDPTLRRHLKWFGTGTVLLWLSGQIGAPWARISDSVVVPIVTYSLFAVSAYCLYRSAKSLAPLGRLTLAGIANPVSTSSAASSPPP